MGWGWSAGFGPPMKGDINPTAYKDILDNYMLSTLWEQFEEDSFLSQHERE